MLAKIGLTPLLILGGILIVAIVSSYYTKKARIKRKLKKTDQKRIASFRDGDIAKIVGTVEIIETPLEAPLSMRKCASFYVLVERKVSSGKSSHWKKIIEEEGNSTYLIKEGGSYAFINDTHINSYIVRDKEYSSGFLNDATDHLEKYLNSKGHESEGLFNFNKTLRYKEGILEQGEKIAVIGKGQWQEASTLGLPKKYGKVLALTSNEGKPMYLSDDPDTTRRRRH